MGRPASYDRDQLLDEVTELFWRQGYYSTSVTDLVKTTRLNPGSLYNAFENKQGLLQASLTWYGRRSISRARQAMQQCRDIESAVRDFFSTLVDAMIADPEARGCFLVNIWLEVACHDDAIRTQLQAIFGRIEQEFRDAFIQARKRGELKQSCDPEVLASYLMMSIWGLRVMSRGRPGREQLEAMVEQVMHAVRAASASRDDYDVAL